jgi:MFS transporter, SP family, galactose:H+ symporter
MEEIVVSAVVVDAVIGGALTARFGRRALIIASFISPMYIAALVPAKVRGSLVAVNMLTITAGIVVAYLADYALSGIQGWRYMSR